MFWMSDFLHVFDTFKGVQYSRISINFGATNISKLILWTKIRYLELCDSTWLLKVLKRLKVIPKKKKKISRSSTEHLSSLRIFRLVLVSRIFKNEPYGIIITKVKLLLCKLDDSFSHRLYKLHKKKSKLKNALKQYHILLLWNNETSTPHLIQFCLQDILISVEICPRPSIKPENRFPRRPQQPWQPQLSANYFFYKFSKIVLSKIVIFQFSASDDLGSPKSRSLSNFGIQSRPRKMRQSMILWHQK